MPIVMIKIRCIDTFHALLITSLTLSLKKYYVWTLEHEEW